MSGNRVFITMPIVMLTGLLAMFPKASIGQESQDVDKVMKLASDTAENICGEVPDSGWNADASVDANINFSIEKFLKKLIAAKAVGEVKADGGYYVGPLREQIGSVRRDTQECKQQVFSLLLKYVADTQRKENVPQVKRIYPDQVKLVPVSVEYPKESAEDFAIKWLHLIDEHNFTQAYDMLDPSVKALQSMSTFLKVSDEILKKCYPAKSRTEDLESDAMIPASQNMFGRNEYGYKFRTIFRNMAAADDDPNEVVGVVLGDGGRWKVIEYKGCAKDMNSVTQVVPQRSVGK